MPTTSEASELGELRRGAWRSFLAAPAPLKTSETWRRVDFARWRLDRLNEASLLPVKGAPPAAALGGAAGAFCEAVGAGRTQALLAPELAAKGVVLKSLEDALASHASLARPALMRCAGQDLAKLEAANAAGWRGGCFLYVPDGVKLDKPIDLSFVHEEASFGFPRLVVLLGENAEATVVEDHTGCEVGGTGRVSIAFSRVKLGRGAKLQYFYNQGFGPDVTHYWNQRVDLAKDARLEHYSVFLGGALHKSDLHVELLEPGARSELFGLVFGAKSQYFDTRTWQMHRAANTQSELLFKTALQEKARSLYTGLIRVDKEATGANAFQQNNNLLLCETARADTTPVLEILTDQVHCKHGATMGPASAEELFYLAARGFEPKEATKALVMGFFEPILRQVPLERLKAQLPDRIERRLA